MYVTNNFCRTLIRINCSACQKLQNENKILFKSLKDVVTKWEENKPGQRKYMDKKILCYLFIERSILLQFRQRL